MVEGWGKVSSTMGGLGVCIALSVLAGAPDVLPPPSLGWELLLHVERAVALLGLSGAALLVGVRALGGRLPIRLGQLEYEADGASVEALERRLGLLEEERSARVAAPTDTADMLVVRDAAKGGTDDDHAGAQAG